MAIGGLNFGTPSMVGPGQAFAAGLQAGLQAAAGGRPGDGFCGSPALLERPGGPLGGLGCGFGNPMAGLGAFGGVEPGQLQALLRVLLRALDLQRSQGMGGPGLGGFPGGLPGGPGGGLAGPGGCPGPGGFGAPGFAGPGCGAAGFGGPGPLGGPQAMGGPGAAQGGTIELQPGQTFTTPGGCTIHWDKKDNDSVKISEPGGGGSSAGGGGARGCTKGRGGASAAASAGAGGASAAASASAGGRSFGVSMALSMAGQMGNQSYAAAFAASMGGGGGPCGCVGAQQGEQQAPRKWRVWGDPHIDHPNGKKSDFDKKNAMFTLSDGTRVLMGADNPKGVVQRVQVILPGGQPNWNGLDPKQTSIMQDQGGMFKPVGTADQFMGGGFGRGW